MKKLITLIGGIALAGLSFAQTVTQEVKSFNKIIASQYIGLELTEGDEEKVEFKAYNVDEADIIIEVKGNTLHIYLEDAKLVDRDQDNYYHNAFVDAKVTYKTLKKLQTRGEEKIVCNSIIKADKFTLKVFGESDVRLEGVDADRLKVSLFGENDLTIKSGNADRQVYKSFGENIVKTKNVKGKFTKTKMYGESDMTVNASDKLRINAFGESDVLLVGKGRISRGIVIGENQISKLSW